MHPAEHVDETVRAETPEQRKLRAEQRNRRRRKADASARPFDPTGLGDEVELTERQTADWLQVAPPTLVLWREDPDHPLRWRKVGKFVRYRVGEIRAYLG